MSATRIRKRTTEAGVEYQGVSIADNWRTEWVKKEETAQGHLDKHLEEGSAKKSRAKKGASGGDQAPGGQDTGPRGGDASEPVPPGGQDTGTRGE